MLIYFSWYNVRKKTLPNKSLSTDSWSYPNFCLFQSMVGQLLLYFNKTSHIFSINVLMFITQIWIWFFATKEL